MFQHGRNHQRAFSVLEGILALALVTTALLTLLTVFSLASSHARLSRDAVLARTVALSVQDEILAQGLGRNKVLPDWKATGNSWTRTYDFAQSIDGRPAAPIHYDVTITRSANGNGAFFAPAATSVPASDVVQATIRWHEKSEKTLSFDVTVVNR